MLTLPLLPLKADAQTPYCQDPVYTMTIVVAAVAAYAKLLGRFPQLRCFSMDGLHLPLACYGKGRGQKETPTPASVLTHIFAKGERSPWLRKPA